jgi:hypothetical protein
MDTEEKIIDSNGYVRVWVGDGNNRKLEFEHRIVAEQCLGRRLRRGEIVHHIIEENKTDNSPENLAVFPNKSTHSKHHYLMNIGQAPELISLADY